MKIHDELIRQAVNMTNEEAANILEIMFHKININGMRGDKRIEMSLFMYHAAIIKAIQSLRNDKGTMEDLV